MNRTIYIQTFLILSCIIISCSTKEKSEKLLNEKLVYDCAALTDSTHPTISRIDSSSIDTLILDGKITSLMDSADVTGLAIAIFNNNQIVFRKTFGFANIKKKTSLQINHSFYAASLSKAVFGYLVAILANESVIDLDKPLQQYLEFPLYNLKSENKWQSFEDLKDDKRYEKITARMCLSHTTGFQNWRWIPRPNDQENREKLKIYFEPGTQYYYSGEGIMLLQYVIEHITGIGIEELANKKVFKPLQMTNTSYVWQDKFKDKFCNGHTEKQAVIKKNKWDEAQAAGSMVTNLIDYSVFVKHILQLYNQDSEIIKMMFNPNFRIHTKTQFGPLSLEQSDKNDNIQLSYGLGWGLLQSPYGLGAFKEGHDEGFQHYSIIFPDKEIGVVILSNSDNAESIFKELLEVTIADKYTPWKWENYIPFQMKK